MAEKEMEHCDDCGIPNKCTRVVPTRVVLIDNAPTVTMFILGTILLYWIWWPFAFVFAVYCGLCIVLFWALICPHCSHYDTRACPCGYGVIAPRFFKFKGTEDFQRIFRQRLSIMYPPWIVPTIAGIYLFYTYGLQTHILIVFILFAIVGFGLIPSISKFVGCDGCEIKEDCPWMGIISTSKKDTLSKRRS